MDLQSSLAHHRIHAKIAGIFYIVAAAASIIALSLFKPILYEPDFLLQDGRKESQIILGAFFQLITIITVAGTGIMLYPYLRRFNEHLALGYFIFRLMEAVLILIGLVGVLSLLTLSHSYIHDTNPLIINYRPAGVLLKAMHDWTFILGPNFMLGINTFLYSFIFYRSSLIPSGIAVLGLAAASLIFIASLLEMFGLVQQVSVWGVLFGIPVFVYEMALAVRLIVRGFNKDSVLFRQF